MEEVTGDPVANTKGLCIQVEAGGYCLNVCLFVCLFVSISVFVGMIYLDGIDWEVIRDDSRHCISRGWWVLSVCLSVCLCVCLFVGISMFVGMI